MLDGMLLQSVEGLEESAFAVSGGELWERLQGEKEEIYREIQANGSVIHTNSAEDPEVPAQEFEWQHRGSLEERLRALNDAQDRLSDGRYGECVDCGGKISARRLAADPAASFCFACQAAIEGEVVCHTM
jgi:RNA polymerase-binding transcription factor DksA